MPNKATLLFETLEGLRDFVALEIRGVGLELNAGVHELVPEHRASLIERLRKEISTIIDRKAFPSQTHFETAVNQTADRLVTALDQGAHTINGTHIQRTPEGRITGILTHRSLDEQKRQVFEVLHDPAKFRAPFLVEIADREKLRFIVTEKDGIGSIIPAGQRDPHVEARTARFIHPETGERLYQQVYISTKGRANNPMIHSGAIASSQDRLVNGFAHETIHNTPLDKLFSKRIANGEAAVVDKLIADDIAHLEAVDAKLKQALSIRSANPAEDFATISKATEANAKLAPLFDEALIGFDKRTLHSILSAHDLRQAVKANAIPAALPTGVTAQDYVDGLREAVKTMSENIKLPRRMMNYFPPSRYPDRTAVLNEYPGQVFSMMALKGIPATECMLPRLTPLLCDEVKQTYGIDPKAFTLPKAAHEKVTARD